MQHNTPIVQAVRVEIKQVCAFWKKLPFFAQVISNMIDRYLTYNLHDKNIPAAGMICGLGHVMQLRQGQIWTKFKNSE